MSNAPQPVELETTLTIRIDSKLKAQAEAVAREEDRSISSLVRVLLRDYVQSKAAPQQ